MSLGGRITLIKAAMPNILVYHMSLFKMPTKIIRSIEKLQRDFLWEGGSEKNDHLVRWFEVCKPKELGGLGMGCLKERNTALLGKWFWRFLVEGESL